MDARPRGDLGELCGLLAELLGFRSRFSSSVAAGGPLGGATEDDDVVVGPPRAAPSMLATASSTVSRRRDGLLRVPYTNDFAADDALFGVEAFRFTARSDPGLSACVRCVDFDDEVRLDLVLGEEVAVGCCSCSC